jgi:hypothetical protein
LILTDYPSAIVVTLLLMFEPKDVVRDGRHIALFKEPNFKEKITGILTVLYDPKIIIMLLPMYVGELCLAITSSINCGCHIQSESHLII